jgi:dihydroorotate dehydrogenase
MSPEDAYKKIQYGASLVQLVSGLVFEGPSLVARITHKLPALLHRDGFASIRDAIGSRA